MAIGDLTAVDGTDLYYVDVGAYDVQGYGSVYILDADRPAVVDTGLGTNVDTLLDAIDDVGIDHLDAILTTHIHLDHAGGAGFLAEAFPDATVYAHDIGVRHLVDPSRLVAGRKPPSVTSGSTTSTRSRFPKTASNRSTTATRSISATARST
jgi:glyoxylase-like metal-dependent hydrolase (beta-lactamase superfamily II)